MKILSLFDGISCGQQALKEAGIKVDTYYASEIESSSIAITQFNHPNTIQLGDITKITNEQLDTLGHIDMVIGGSPCQDLSSAKIGGKGLEGSKSCLFWHFVRILNHTQPKYFLLENVESMKDEWRDLISSILGVQPTMVDSNLLTAQDRKRYYWCNFNTTQPADTHVMLKDIVLNASEVDSKYWYDKDFTYNGDNNKIQCTLNIKGMDSIKRVYNLEGKAPTLTCDGDGGHRVKKVYQDGKCRKLTPLEYERLQALPDNYTQYGLVDDKVIKISDSKRYTAIGNGWTVSVIAHLFSQISEF